MEEGLVGRKTVWGATWYQPVVIWRPVLVSAKEPLRSLVNKDRSTTTDTSQNLLLGSSISTTHPHSLIHHSLHSRIKTKREFA